MLIDLNKTDRLEHRIEILEAAIRKHRDATGHEACWLNDQELYDVLGDPLDGRKLPPEPEFLRRCKEYYDAQLRGNNPDRVS